MATRLYIVLRSDLLGMSPGRAAAQASHGTSDFHESFAGLSVSTSPAHSMMKSSFKEWKSEAGNFGTAIVLKATYSEIIDLLHDADSARLKDPSKYNFYWKEIIDPEYFYKGPGELFEAHDVMTGAVFFIPPNGSEETEKLYEKIAVLPLF